MRVRTKMLVDSLDFCREEGHNGVAEGGVQEGVQVRGERVLGFGAGNGVLIM